MYSKKQHLIIGFHGCEESVRDELVNHKTNMKISKNTYDWLGSGMYFWENNDIRALE